MGVFALGVGGKPLLVLNRALLLDSFNLFPSTSLSLSHRPAAGPKLSSLRWSTPPHITFLASLE